MNEEGVTKNTKMATKFGVTVFNAKLFKSACLQKSDKFIISRQGSKIRLGSYFYGR